MTPARASYGQAGTLTAIPATEEEWATLFQLLKAASGVDFSLYKKPVLHRRLARWMADSKAQGWNDHLSLLKADHATLCALADRLLSLETEFFRDRSVFTELERKVFPRILARKRGDEPIRIWVAGCSTGEDVYSVAISLMQSFRENTLRPQIQIFATDFRENVLKIARARTYSAADVKRIPPKILLRYFTAVTGGFQVDDAIRDLCIFARHNPSKDPPFARLDLISCRNFLIDMAPVVQKKILASFYYGLRPDGMLLLGKSDVVSDSDLFVLENNKSKLYTRKEGAASPSGSILPAHPLPGQAWFSQETAAGFDLEKEAMQIVWARYAHAGLVVNGELEILHFLGDTSPYARPVPAGSPLMRAVREEFAVGVRTAVQKALRGKSGVRREGVEFRRGNRLHEVSVEVHPLMRQGRETPFLVLFEPGAGRDGAGEQARRRKQERQSDRQDVEVRRLRAELTRAQEHAQAIIHDQEVAHEELKASSEQTRSSLVELQSINEELEIAKQELESGNQELVALSEQLQNRNHELAELSTDLGNVLSGIQIPVVLVDVDRRVRRFTPPAGQLLELVDGDLGRRIGELRIRFDRRDLEDLISAAIENAEGAAWEGQWKNGRWYSLRIRPFLASEDRLQGVLIALVDIDAVKRLEQQATARAKLSESTAQALLESAAQAILACDQAGRIRLANRSAEKMFGHSREALIGRTLESLLPERLRTAHSQQRAGWFARPRNRPMGIGLELAGLRSDGSEFPIEVSLSSIPSERGTLGVAFISDITERRRADQVLSETSRQLASQVSALDRLRRTNDELWENHDLRSGLEQMLGIAMDLLGADMGVIQLLNPHKQVLEVVAQRGFGPEFLEHFREIGASDVYAAARSLRTRERVIIEDVNTDAEFTPMREVAAAAGYRAVQSTPLFGPEGALIGTFSTHFRQPHRPSELELAQFDLYAAQAAQFVERVRSESQLQGLTRRLLMTQEEGNREIARELHDLFSQELVAVGMEIASLNKRRAAADQAGLGNLGERVVDLAKRLHQTSRKLHPSVLEDLGLEPALRQECEAFQNSNEIPAQFTASAVPSTISLDVALCLYRVAQESFRNIRKHAPETDRVWVTLAGTPGGITLTVKDQGDGFELDEALRKGGLGLISMEERVRAENGKLTIQSKPGRGTTVTAFVPLENG